uniref:Uncharacterized protein n=1 Tax=Helianthus annuus TaxID=4232 RepID=A0A251TZA9_HELAN
MRQLKRSNCWVNVSHPNRWRNHRGAALGESDCSRESITTMLRYIHYICYPILTNNTIT